MNKKAILKTAVWKADPEDGSLIVESPLMPGLVGAGSTKEEAWESFNIFLDSAYTAYLEDRLGSNYGKRGRPAKDNFELHVKVREKTRSTLKDLAEEKECSQGEVIDYLTALHDAINLLVEQNTQFPTFFGSVLAPDSTIHSQLSNIAKPDIYKRLSKVELQLSELKSSYNIVKKKSTPKRRKMAS